MTDNNNVFEREDLIFDLVSNAGLNIPEYKIRQIYQEITAKYEEERKDEWSIARITEDWQIPIKISPRKYRTFADVMNDVSDLWLRSDANVRDDICRMFMGISSDNWTFYEIMDCCHKEAFMIDTAEIDESSVFVSAEKLKSALDDAMTDERSMPFRPPINYVNHVWRYIVFGINRARADQEQKNKLKELGIDVDKPICEVFTDIAHSYETLKGTHEHIEIQRAFWFGVPSYALMFVNVMDRITEYIFKEKRL